MPTSVTAACFRTSDTINTELRHVGQLVPSAPCTWPTPLRLDEACLTGNRLRLDRSPATAIRNFHPLPASPPFLADQESRFRPPSIAFRPWRVRSDRLRSVDCHRGREGRGPKHKERNITMATIGTFTTSANGFTGTIKTLNLNVKARIERVDNPCDKGPHFRIYSGAVELGAAWQKTAKETERDYLAVKLDDPSFPAPIYATLIEVDGQEGLQLIWSRPNRD
jgi:uncharacterized protein (DUF736 family)